jgi:hypothetical protein
MHIWANLHLWGQPEYLTPFSLQGQLSWAEQPPAGWLVGRCGCAGRRWAPLHDSKGLSMAHEVGHEPGLRANPLWCCVAAAALCSPSTRPRRCALPFPS